MKETKEYFTAFWYVLTHFNETIDNDFKDEIPRRQRIVFLSALIFSEVFNILMSITIIIGLIVVVVKF